MLTHLHPNHLRHRRDLDHQQQQLLNDVESVSRCGGGNLNDVSHREPFSCRLSRSGQSFDSNCTSFHERDNSRDRLHGTDSHRRDNSSFCCVTVVSILLFHIHERDSRPCRVLAGNDDVAHLLAVVVVDSICFLCCFDLETTWRLVDERESQKKGRLCWIGPNVGGGVEQLLGPCP